MSKKKNPFDFDGDYLYAEIGNDGRPVFSRDRWGMGSRDWLDPRRTNDKHSHPYSYDCFYIWRDGNLEDSHADYHDRLQQADYEKFKEVCELFPKKRFDAFTRADCSKFLTSYYGKEIVATALVEGCNVSNGYPYWVFYYKEKA